MTKKKTAPKTKATPKAAPKAATKKKAPGTPKKPSWLKPFPVDYILGTEDYAAIIMDHNKLFGSDYNRWRVQPQVFYTIHERILSHYNDKK